MFEMPSKAFTKRRWTRVEHSQIPWTTSCAWWHWMQWTTVYHIYWCCREQHVNSKKHCERTTKNCKTLDELNRQDIAHLKQLQSMKHLTWWKQPWCHKKKEVVSSVQTNQLDNGIMLGCKCIVQSDGLAECVWFLQGELQLSQGDTFYSLTEIECKERLHCTNENFWSSTMPDGLIGWCCVSKLKVMNQNTKLKIVSQWWNKIITSVPQGALKLQSVWNTPMKLTMLKKMSALQWKHLSFDMKDLVHLQHNGNQPPCTLAKGGKKPKKGTMVRINHVIGLQFS